MHMEIDKSNTKANRRVEVIFSRREIPVLDYVLSPYSSVDEVQELDHTESLLMDISEQVHIASRDYDFIFSVRDSDLEYLLHGLEHTTNLYLAKIGFSADVVLELLTIRESIISDLDVNQSISPEYNDSSFRARKIASDMAFDFANPSRITINN